MRGMQSAAEFIQAPPPGRYPIQFDGVEAKLSAKGESMLKITGSVSDGPFKGALFFHNIGTDGGTKFGAMGKKHFRALGVPVDSDAEVPDSILAAKLQGLRLLAECGNEPRLNITKGVNGAPDIESPVMQIGPNGQQIPVMNLSIIGYIREPGARVDLGLPTGPTQQGFVPQGVQQQYAQQPQQQYAAPQYQQPQGGFVPGAPNGLPPGVAPQFAAGVATPPWNGAAGVPQGNPQQLPGHLPPGMGLPPGR